MKIAKDTILPGIVMLLMASSAVFASDFTIKTSDGDIWNLADVGVSDGKADSRPKREIHGFRGNTFITIQIANIRVLTFTGKSVVHENPHYKDQRLREADITTTTGVIKTAIRIGFDRVPSETLHIVETDKASGAKVLIDS